MISSGNENGVNSIGSTDVTQLHDIANYIQNNGTSGTNPYDHIIDMMRGMNLHDDGITMNNKIKFIATDYCSIVHDEVMLRDSIGYINDKALDDTETVKKFALLFASRKFDELAMGEQKLRSEMLHILNKNFLDAHTLRVHDRNRLYNSITLLGEYYQRVRLQNNHPIDILGQSLLDLLIYEVSDINYMNDAHLAKLILTQISVNGEILRSQRHAELLQLLYIIRKNLIEQPNLKSTVKAFMLMTLDTYYTNLSSLGTKLEEMYTKYYIMMDEEDGENNNQGKNIQQPNPSSSETELCKSSVNHNKQQQIINIGCENGGEGSNLNTTLVSQNSANSVNNQEEPSEFCSTKKKWSDEVWEEGFAEVILNYEEFCTNGSANSSPEQVNSNCYDERQMHNSRRSYRSGRSPRPLKQHQNNNCSTESRWVPQNQSGDEERDETKPLPRWRATRFNRSENQRDATVNNGQRRYSVSLDDDRQSVQSENNGIRLYSINDRLKHAQEKIERSGNSAQYNGLANSNWDRQSQRDDRSERSYQSNYERGNQRRNGRQYNNWNAYEKPPRFQKQKSPTKNHKNGSDGRIFSETWRRSNNQHNENCNYHKNGGDRNEARWQPHHHHHYHNSGAQTLPRRSKSKNNNTYNYDANEDNRRSHSPACYESTNTQQQQQGKGRRSQHFSGNRYSSQSSLTASETSSNVGRQHPSRHHQSQQQQRNRCSGYQENHMDANREELVRNARQTTKYMNYLSTKK